MYTIVDFAREFVREVLFSVLILGLAKLGRILIKWSKPYLREFMNLLGLIFQYFAFRLRLESPLTFLIIYLKYLGLWRIDQIVSTIAKTLSDEFLQVS